jgi:hypothetical protein
MIAANGISQPMDNKLCGNSDEIKKYLISKKYVPMIEIDSIIGEYKEEKVFEAIEDFTKLIVKIQGVQTSVFDLAKRDLKGPVDQGLSFKAFITENESFCEEALERKIKTGFDGANLDGAFYLHVWESNNPKIKSILFMKYKEVTWDALRRNHPVSRIDSLTRNFKFEGAETYPKRDYSTKFEFLPMDQWREGMRFLVDDKDCTTGPVTHFSEYKNQESRFDIKENLGEIFTFKRYEKRDKERNGRTYSLSLLIFEKDGKDYEYIDRGILRYILNLVYIDDLETVKKDLLGKDIYLIVDFAEEYDADGKQIRKYRHNASDSQLEKFTKVKVTKIENGIQDGPARIWFDVEGKENRFCHFVSFSRINDRNGCIIGKNFDEVFMVKDPKVYYDFDDGIWSKIMSQEIASGMSTDAVRLSQGASFGVAKSIQRDDEYQLWDYGSHKVLFKNKVVIEVE